MDRIQQLNYEKDFRIAFLESKGDGFQRLFEKLMMKAHPNDFMACRPWGNVGDRKNDGYLVVYLVFVLAKFRREVNY